MGGNNDSAHRALAALCCREGVEGQPHMLLARGTLGQPHVLLAQGTLGQSHMGHRVIAALYCIIRYIHIYT